MSCFGGGGARARAKKKMVPVFAEIFEIGVRLCVSFGVYFEIAISH